MALSQNLDFRDSCSMSSCCLPVSCPPLSPSGFLDDPYLTFHTHMISRKGFWDSLLSKSFSYIQKPEGSQSSPNNLKILFKLCLSLRWGGSQASPTPEHPKEFPCKYFCFSGWGRIKRPLLLKIPLTIQILLMGQTLPFPPEEQSKIFIIGYAPDIRVNLSTIWPII